MFLLKYEDRPCSHSEFVDFWSAQYDPGKDADRDYWQNITSPFTPEKVRNLFKWKNGSKLSATKESSVEKHFVANVGLLSQIPKDESAAKFLARFPYGGPIFRIFWLHCWRPELFPIYDMHVHRAMEFIEKRQLIEIPSDPSEKVEAYLNRYLDFHAGFKGGQRAIDQALWAYGKFLKSYPKFSLAPK